MKKNLPDPKRFIGETIPGLTYKIQSYVASGCNGLVFSAKSEALQQELACKIIPLANLIGEDENPPRWQEEVRKANRVKSDRVVKFFEMGKWKLGDEQFVYLLSDFVNGVSLGDYLKKHRKEIDMGFVEAFLGGMLGFLHELTFVGLQHGDFHEGNILVEDRTEALGGEKYGFKVTDFGVHRATTGELLLDDFEQLATMLRKILGQVEYTRCSARDRFVYNIINDDILAKGLTERDPNIDPRARNPKELYATLINAPLNYAKESAGNTRRKLLTPFDFLSCEQIGESHALLKELYSNKMLGLPAIEGINNLVLTGPRGCGKTTVFRSLSLKHLTHTGSDPPEGIKYVGVYYRCDDLYFAFPRYQQPQRPEALDIPVHFLTATLAKELLDSVGGWLRQHQPKELEQNEPIIASDIWDCLRLQRPAQPNANTFDSLSRALQRERERAASKQRFANDPKHTFEGYWGPDVLPELCNQFLLRFETLRDLHIFFFIDDYSTPKITPQLQQNINRLVMQRTAACFFKIATESPASYERCDIDGKTYVESREFSLVNLGMDFINADPDEKMNFVDDIFGRRFAYCDDYPVKTLLELIGEEATPSPHNDVARKLREGKQPTIWGRTALGDLCSGDVHFLIDLVGKMVTAKGGPTALVVQGNEPAIDAATQNKTIRAEAGNFLKNLRALPTGQTLVDVVEAFGAIASSYLKHRNSGNEGASPPHQASRIEPFEDPRLEGQAKQVYEDLLRYSVFLEDVRGKSRRQHVVPRLLLRRFLIPFFNLTFSKRDSLELSVDEFCQLLINPREFQEKKRLKKHSSSGSEESAKGPNLSPAEQLDLGLLTPNSGRTK